MDLEYIILILMIIINPQLTLSNSSILIKTTNNILVDIKLKERTGIVNPKGKLAGLPFKTIKTSFPTTKSSTSELPSKKSTGMKPYMDQ